ncbi:MAG: bifunctional demethylmenaquinone methyltransferase/2-methoxy-6-polyprenyl-1,4-benzoquinol methylase UbiE [Myxococcales bacterium]|nr:bifunctional demethylmenaquinone methyltransferase/2-methoxy-6-polyprenyl-1,4-benzoquinol methylase UbiE [Myxococcales bacterium]
MEILKSSAPIDNKPKSPDGSGRMFDGIAARYDLLNRIISLGMDQFWRRAAVRSLQLHPGDRVLDLATGTADLPLAILKYYPEVTVVGVDPSEGMLQCGRKKIAKVHLQSSIELVNGDAQALSFPSNSFNGVSMAFGIRNVPNRKQALTEIARVLEPGGRVAILELSEPKNGWLSRLARLHMQWFVPAVGAALSGKAEYGYLRTSIEAFPRPEIFEDMMRQAGLDPISQRTFALGSCVLYVASRRKDTP